MPWDIDTIFSSLNKKICPPGIVAKRPELAWDYTGITKKYWVYITDYRHFSWDLSWVENKVYYDCVDEVYGYDDEHNRNVLDMDSFHRVLVFHRERPWKFAHDDLDKYVLKSITNKNSLLYGYNWNKKLLRRACKYRIANSLYTLEPWMYDLKLYKPTR